MDGQSNSATTTTSGSEKLSELCAKINGIQKVTKTRRKREMFLDKYIKTEHKSMFTKFEVDSALSLPPNMELTQHVSTQASQPTVVYSNHQMLVQQQQQYAPIPSAMNSNLYSPFVKPPIVYNFSICLAPNNYLYQPYNLVSVPKSQMIPPPFITKPTNFCNQPSLMTTPHVKTFTPAIVEQTTQKKSHLQHLSDVTPEKTTHTNVKQEDFREEKKQNHKMDLRFICS